MAIAAVIGVTALTVIADYFCKMASAQENPILTKWFVFALIFFASSTFAWVYIMKYLQLGTIGVLYSVSTVLLLTVVGIVFFGEAVTLYEIVGIIMAVIALGLLGRFA